MASRPHLAFPRTPPARACRIFVVDDSIVARVSISRILGEDGRFSVVGQAASAADALLQLPNLACDIIILDIEMPGMSGLDAIPPLREASGDAAILVLSSHCRAGAEASVRAMRHGAADTMLKPEAGNLQRSFGERLVYALSRIADGIGDDADAAAAGLTGARTCGRRLARPVRCLAIAASTGGVHATNELMRALPPTIDMPVLVTQHLPADFIEPFARQMTRVAGRPFTAARDGHRLAEGEVLVAPGNAHLALARDGEAIRICLSRRKAPSGCTPSADPMFESLAALFGRDAVGVVLSGMGRDGSLGAQSLAEAGAELLVQDSRSAVVWGMPGAVADRGIASLIGTPAALGRHVARRAEAFGWR